MPPKIARLAGLGAFGAIIVFLLIYFLIAWVARHTATGGMMMSLSWVTWISLSISIIGLIIVHVNIGRQLLYIANGGGPREV